MSTKENTIWLEAAKENFDQAVAEGRFGLAKDIIEDIRDQGFEKEADSLKLVLQLWLRL